MDHTCLTHIAATLSDLAVVKFNQNEFVFGAQESFGEAIFLTRTSHAAVDDNVIRGQDGVTPPGVGAINLMYVHDSEVLRNTLTWTAVGIGLFSSWNNHLAENTWMGAGQSAGFNDQTADWWSLDIVSRVGTGGIGLEHWVEQ